MKVKINFFWLFNISNFIMTVLPTIFLKLHFSFPIILQVFFYLECLEIRDLKAHTEKASVNKVRL